MKTKSFQQEYQELYDIKKNTERKYASLSRPAYPLDFVF
jgi:hypothetical protein